MEEQQDRIVVGLDIGTTKVCAIVASLDPQDRIHILGVGKAPSDGLNRGVVVNIDKTVNAIQTAIEQAQLASGIEVNSVNVGIAGDHIRSMRSKGVVTINNKDNEITVNDVERLLESHPPWESPWRHQPRRITGADGDCRAASWRTRCP